MRVLLDENLDWRLVRYFDADFQVPTVSRQGTGKEREMVNFSGKLPQPLTRSSQGNAISGISIFL